MHFLKKILWIAAGIIPIETLFSTSLPTSKLPTIRFDLKGESNYKTLETEQHFSNFRKEQSDPGILNSSSSGEVPKLTDRIFETASQPDIHLQKSPIKYYEFEKPDKSTDNFTQKNPCLFQRFRIQKWRTSLNYPYTNIFDFFAPTIVDVPRMGVRDFGPRWKFTQWNFQNTEENLNPEELDITPDSHISSFLEGYKTPPIDAAAWEGMVVPLFSDEAHFGLLLDHPTVGDLLSFFQNHSTICNTAYKTAVDFLSLVDKDQPIFVSLPDLHGNHCIYDSLLDYIEYIVNQHDNTYVIIPGDLAHRMCTKEEQETLFTSTALKLFLRGLSKIVPGRVFFIPGNHDTQSYYDLLKVLKYMKQYDIRILNNAVKGICPDMKHLFKPWEITGNICFFSYGTNYANGGLIPPKTEVFDPNLKAFVESPLVFDTSHSRAFELFEKDRFERLGAVDVEEISPGQMNMITEEIAQNFLIAVTRLAELNPTGSLNFVVIGHEFYIRILQLLEKISQYPEYRIPRKILERLVVTLVLGHEHKPYMLKRTLFLTDKEEDIVCIPCVCGGGGVWGSHINLFSFMRGAQEKPVIIPAEKVTENRKRLIKRQEEKQTLKLEQSKRPDVKILITKRDDNKDQKILTESTENNLILDAALPQVPSSADDLPKIPLINEEKSEEEENGIPINI